MIQERLHIRMGIVGRRKIPWLSNIRVSRESPVAELGRWTLPYISLSSRISSMVLARVKSPSLLSDRLLPRGQALRPAMGLAPSSPRVSEAKCELQVEDWSFRSVSALSPSDSFLGHCPRNRKFFPSTQALQPQWRRASKKRPQNLRSSAFTCRVRQRRGDYLGVPDRMSIQQVLVTRLLVATLGRPLAFTGEAEQRQERHTGTDAEDTMRQKP